MVNMPTGWGTSPRRKAKKKATKKKATKKKAKKKVVKKKATKRKAKKKVVKKKATKRKAKKKVVKKKAKPKKSLSGSSPPKTKTGYTLTHVPTGLAFVSNRKSASHLKKCAEALDEMPRVDWGSRRVINAAFADPPPRWFSVVLGRRAVDVIEGVRKNPARPRPKWKKGSGASGWRTEEVEVSMSDGLHSIEAEVLYPNRHWGVHKSLGD